MTLLAREQELPRERAAFYEAAVNVLCHHWDANRNRTLPETDYLRLDDKKELLRRVAMGMQTGQSSSDEARRSNAASRSAAATQGSLAANAIHETDLEDEVASWFRERFRQSEFEAIKSARLMIQQLRERNYILCLRGPRLYGFVHRTFLEFLTAAEYVARFKDERTLSEAGLYDSHCQDEDWREVLRLIAGQVNEQVVGQIVERLATRTDLEELEDSTLELPLAIYCLSEVRTLGRLESAGGRLLDAVMKVFIPGCGSVGFHNALLTATQEIQDRWPGACDVNRRVLGLVSQVNEQKWAAVFLPQFLGAIRPDRVVQEQLAVCSNCGLRSGALQALASTWPDESTRELLRARAVQDENAETRGATCSAFGKMHSEFGRILPTKDLDGTGPYLDPRQLIPREHVERAAKQAGIASADLDATLADLSRHLGWDVTRGAGPSC